MPSCPFSESRMRMLGSAQKCTKHIRSPYICANPLEHFPHGGSMSRHDILTEEDMRRFKIQPFFTREIKGYAERFGLKPSQVRILDWGCGRGQLTAALIAEGYDAYGIEIDPEPVRNGYDLFVNRGLDPEQRLRVIGKEGASNFPNGFFHFLCSYQVLEHIECLDVNAGEWERITAEEAVGVHIYPGAWRLIEPHLLLPFLHWLPKNTFRQAYIRLAVSMGLIPEWIETKGRSPAEQTKVYFDYSVQNTYYRNPRRLVQTLGAFGWDVRYEPGGSSALAPSK